MWFEIAIVLILILVNGLLAMSEMAIVSARPARMKVMAERGDHGAQLRQPDVFDGAFDGEGVRGRVDVFARAGEVDELADLGEHGVAEHPRGGGDAALDLPEMEVLKALEELCIEGRVKRRCIPLDRSPESGNSVFYGISE